MHKTSEEREAEEKILTPFIEEFMKRYELHKIHVDFMQRAILLVIAGLGLITALSWDDLFKDIFQEMFGHLPSLQEKLIYAVFLTVATAVITVLLTKFIKRSSRKDNF